MTTLHLRVGFMPLVDAALLVAAADSGIAEGHSLSLELVREVSWSNLRDRLHVRLLDVAHILAPAAIASTLGIGGVTAPMAAPLMLNLNGNALTLSLRRAQPLLLHLPRRLVETTGVFGGQGLVLEYGDGQRAQHAVEAVLPHPRRVGQLGRGPGPPRQPVRDREADRDLERGGEEVAGPDHDDLLRGGGLGGQGRIGRGHGSPVDALG